MPLFMILMLIIATALLLMYCGLLIFYLRAWNKLSFNPLPQNYLPRTSITVTIPARNEEFNLPILLRSLKDQDYPLHLLEVIVIDDFSSDQTAGITRDFGDMFKTIRLQDHVTDPLNSYKKKAIETGISFAKGELIVTTDADCIVPRSWIKNIAYEYEQKRTAMIVMPVRIINDNSFLSIFQSLDFMSLQGITGASAGLDKFIMCNGANLAYDKNNFIELNGFAGIDELASGDDMMLLHKFSKSGKKISYIKNEDVIVSTAPMRSISDFLNQRIRWASKSDKYQDKKIMPILLLVYSLNLVMFLVPFFILVFPSNRINAFMYWILLLIVKTGMELIFLSPVADFFKQRKLLAWFPLAQPLHIIYTVIAGFLGKFGKYKWKGRTVQ